MIPYSIPYPCTDTFLTAFVISCKWNYIITHLQGFYTRDKTLTLHPSEPNYYSERMKRNRVQMKSVK